jgi:formamidopyrimidine-DNA glycosylase
VPELPDVEIFKRYLDATALHKQVRTVEIRSASVVDTSAAKLHRALEGTELVSTRRHGKYLLAALADGGWLVLHFGMTGLLRYFKDEEEDAEHDRVLLSFANGYRLAYVNQRLFGHVDVTQDADAFVAKKGLGPDLLGIERDAFVERLSGRRGAIKPTLMNQSVVAGLGNVYTDEVLLQARVDPRATAGKLGEKRLGALHATIQKVLEEVIGFDADPARAPARYLLPHREEGEPCPGKCGGEVKRITVSGRAGYYCPSCQRR